MLGIAVKESGLTATEVFWEMPVVIVYAWEHYSYRANGIDTKRMGKDDGAMGGESGAVLDALLKME